MRVRVHGIQHIADLANDLAEIPVRMVPLASNVVRTNVREGRRLARASARSHSPVSGQHYDDAITDEMLTAYMGEYGPDVSLPQGNMDFEFGSGRQSSPHLNMAHSADAIGPKFADDAGDMLGKLFW